jgi:hypothetical protein
LEVSRFLAPEHFQGRHLLDPCTSLADLRGTGDTFSTEFEQSEASAVRTCGFSPFKISTTSIVEVESAVPE